MGQENEGGLGVSEEGGEEVLGGGGGGIGGVGVWESHLGYLVFLEAFLNLTKMR